MDGLKPIKPEKLIKIIGSLGFLILRQSGSHVIMKHPDGRTTVVPFHKGELIDRGLLRKIIRDELKISRDEFLELV
ncbi:MAG: type II toxin-antitoxin system HicA family toxin [Nanoarchaeota archaeon]|nr:type II toxin-antitoxin system HicA family toxin [Nanoarchaeota archaeon]MBU4299592.1 type II toxin-antitoxin system HicA family toxin [Nanoarchaeota archaeon]MBU4452101.1 type II toxin-antitoxin system HicA family toxin [Nanoarchaeota archaeon]MCG2723731.1 type II toxin-antitoxin system HicA family toxin [archaeon]